MSTSDRSDSTLSRRDFVKAAAYTAPAIMTLKALPAFASQGSGHFGNGGNGGRGGPLGNNGVGNGEDPQPPGNPPQNDGTGTGPSTPGNRGRGRGNR
jgi:hypothetical protein